MHKQKSEFSTYSIKRMLSVSEGIEYTGLGKTTFRSWADKIGATRHIGKRVLFDRVKIDEALESEVI